MGCMSRNSFSWASGALFRITTYLRIEIITTILRKEHVARKQAVTELWEAPVVWACS